jgi:CubicO group peptidase (beta-lactamase class C family)
MPDLATVLASWAAQVSDERAALAVVGTDGVVASHGDVGRPLRLASVTKPLVAWTVLVAVADGTIDLDERAGPTTEQGATVRHLLAHAAGLDLEAGGRTTAPGFRRGYSNWGYEVLGGLLAERCGRPVAEVLADDVLGPLGMAATSLEGSPAHGAIGSTADLARFVTEVLDPRLLPPALAAEATAVALPGLNGVLPGYGRQQPNDWALGLEVRGTKEPHWGGRLPASAVGHFGRSGSLVWVDRERGVGLVSVGGRDFGDWARTAWPELTDAVLDVVDAGDIGG